MAAYELCSRFTLLLRRAQLQLALVWRDLLRAKNLLAFESTRENFKRAVAARLEMAAAVHSLATHANAEVSWLPLSAEACLASAASSSSRKKTLAEAAQPRSWAAVFQVIAVEMRELFKGAENGELSVKELQCLHARSMRAVLGGLFLDSAPLSQSLSKLLSGALTFATHVRHFTAAASPNDAVAFAREAVAVAQMEFADSHSTVGDQDRAGAAAPDDEASEDLILRRRKERLQRKALSRRLRAQERLQRVRCGVESEGFSKMVDAACSAFRSCLKELIGEEEEKRLGPFFSLRRREAAA